MFYFTINLPMVIFKVFINNISCGFPIFFYCFSNFIRKTYFFY